MRSVISYIHIWLIHFEGHPPAIGDPWAAGPKTHDLYQHWVQPTKMCVFGESEINTERSTCHVQCCSNSSPSPVKYFRNIASDWGRYAKCYAGGYNFSRAWFETNDVVYVLNQQCKSDFVSLILWYTRSIKTVGCIQTALLYTHYIHSYRPHCDLLLDPQWTLNTVKMVFNPKTNVSAGLHIGPHTWYWCPCRFCLFYHGCLFYPGLFSCSIANHSILKAFIHLAQIFH